MTASLAVSIRQQNTYRVGESAAFRAADEITADAVDGCLALVTREINRSFALLDAAVKPMVASGETTAVQIVSHFVQTGFSENLMERINTIFTASLQARFDGVRTDVQITLSDDVLPPVDWLSEAFYERRRTRFVQRLMSALAENSIQLTVETISAGKVSSGTCKRLDIGGTLVRMLMDRVVHEDFILETTQEIQGWLDCTRTSVLRQTRKQVVNAFYKLHDTYYS